MSDSDAVPNSTPSGNGCATTHDGNTVCLVAYEGQGSTCGCNTFDSKRVPSTSVGQEAFSSPKSTWHQVRGGIMFGVACLTSPCCTPLLVPLVIVLLAGTPVALWMSQNLGWVYGGLTFISIGSFVVVLGGTSKRFLAKPQSIPPTSIPVLSPAKGAHAHATESTTRL